MTVGDIVGDPDYLVAPYADRYRMLADRLDDNFDHVLRTLDVLPLTQDGAAHKCRRTQVAQALGQNSAAVTAALPEMIAQHFAGLDRVGQHNLLDDMLVPFVDDLLGRLIGQPLELAEGALVSRLFSQSMGVATRRRLNAELGAVWDMLARRGRDAEANMVFLVLGRDAMIGTLGRSLHAHMLATQDAGLSSLPFDPVPTHTGVPYVDRIGRTGAQHRCMLVEAEGGTAAERKALMFGRGAHLCLGRTLSLAVFRDMSAWLAARPHRARVTGFALRKDDVFLIPARFEVEIWN